MTINTELRRKGTCDMASHAYKMHDVEKNVFGPIQK